MMTTLRCGSLLLVVFGAAGLQAQVTVTDGEDYELPTWVRPEPYSGFGSGRRNPDFAIKTLYVNWKQLEPRQGQYDFSSIENALDQAKVGGYKVLLYCKSIEVSGGWGDSKPRKLNVTPDWVLSEDGLNAPTDRLGWEHDLEIAAGWLPEVRRVFNTMVRELGRRGFPQREELAAAYIHGVSASYGEEFWLPREAAAKIEKSLGLSPQILREWIKSRIDAYAEAFAGVEYKLVWNGIAGHPFNFGDYKGVAKELLEYAWAKGCGNRMGIIEAFNGSPNEPAIGQSLDNNGYLSVEETIPPIAEIRYFGDENEAYGPQWEWLFGPQSGDPYRYRMAILRALQSRYRFLLTTNRAVSINQPLSDYARLSFGKTVETTPDVWACLRQSPVWASPGYVKNFERWLVQRDVTGGMTAPADRVERKYGAGSPEGKWYDYRARRTDLATGNKYIYFDVDDRFRIAGPVYLKVEIKDVADCRWRVEYSAPDALPKATPWFQSKTDGRVRTVTFRIDDLQLANAQPHGMDFRIACDGPEDIVVQWVRLVKGIMDAP